MSCVEEQENGRSEERGGAERWQRWGTEGGVVASCREPPSSDRSGREGKSGCELS